MTSATQEEPKDIFDTKFKNFIQHSQEATREYQNEIQRMVADAKRTGRTSQKSEVTNLFVHITKRFFGFGAMFPLDLQTLLAIRNQWDQCKFSKENVTSARVFLTLYPFFVSKTGIFENPDDTSARLKADKLSVYLSRATDLLKEAAAYYGQEQYIKCFDRFKFLQKSICNSEGLDKGIEQVISSVGPAEYFNAGTEVLRAVSVISAKIGAEQYRKDHEVAKPAETNQNIKAANEPQAENIFKKDGDAWTIRFHGETKSLEDCAGFSYIKLLLSQQGKTFTTQAFLSLYNDKPVFLTSGDALLDEKAKENYKDKLTDIEDRLQEAKKHNDFATQEKLEEEKDAIIAELSRAAGFNKHINKLNPEFGKYRLSIGNAIVRAFSKIEDHIPALAEHLRKAISNPHSSTSLGYRTSEPVNWEL